MKIDYKPYSRRPNSTGYQIEPGMTNMMSNRHENKNKISSFWKAFFAYPDKICRNRFEPHERAQRVKAREGFHNPVISGVGWIPSTGYRIESGMTARYDDIKLTGQQWPK